MYKTKAFSSLEFTFLLLTDNVSLRNLEIKLTYTMCDLVETGSVQPLYYVKSQIRTCENWYDHPDLLIKDILPSRFPWHWNKRIQGFLEWNLLELLVTGGRCFVLFCFPEGSVEGDCNYVIQKRIIISLCLFLRFRHIKSKLRRLIKNQPNDQ